MNKLYYFHTILMKINNVRVSSNHTKWT